jgi:putative FmdB family regulatory protein
MPIYEYECSQCRYYLEVMQKISDAKLKKCPSCGKNALQKLISAPVFRLKGSGWYETDFKSDQERKRNLAGAEKDDAPADPKGAKDGKDSKDSADGKAATDGKDTKSGGADSAGEAKSAGGDAKGESAAAGKGRKKADKTPERAASRSARGAKKAPKRAPAKPKSSPKRGRR